MPPAHPAEFRRRAINVEGEAGAPMTEEEMQQLWKQVNIL